MMKVRDNIALWILLSAALIFKLGYLIFALPEPASSTRLSIDALYHYKWASLIASGEILANAPYFRAPLYPFLLAGLIKVSGGSLIFVRLIQLLAGCLTLFFVYRIAALRAGKAAALVAVLLLILYPVTTYFEGELLLDSVFTLLALITLYLFISESGDLGRFFLAGVFFALAALTRPTILIFLPVIAIYFFTSARFRNKKKAGFRRLLLFLVTAGIIIAPVTIINHWSSGQFILISYQGGINFYLGNNPEADGLSSTLPGAGRDWTLKDADYLAYRDTGRKIVYGAQSYFWYWKGLGYIVSNPGRFAELFARKLYFIFSGHEVSNNRPLDEVVFQNAWLSYLPVKFSLLISLAVLPVFFVRDNRKHLLLLYGLILLYGVTMAMFFVSSRFRLPMVPLVAIAAGWGVVSLIKTLRRRLIGPGLFFGIVCAAGVFILTSTMIFPLSLKNRQQSLFLRGNQAFRRGDYRTALARFDSLAEINPGYENCNLNRGIAYLKMGQPHSAEAGFREELFHNPQSAEAANNLGVIFLLRNELDSARFYCRRALRIKPYYTEAAVNFLRSVRGVVDPIQRDSIESIRQSVRAVNDRQPRYLFEEALYFTGLNRYREAIDNHLRLIEILSSRQPSVSFGFTYSEDAAEPDRLLTLAYYQLGYLYGLQGEYETSIRFSKDAISRDPDLKEAYINLITGYRSLGWTYPADSVAGVYLSRWPDDAEP